MVIAYFSTPSPENARTAEYYGIEYRRAVSSALEPERKPGEWLEYSPLLTILVAALLCWYLVNVFRTSPQGALAALDLNTYNLMFITVGLLLHWQPKALYACGGRVHSGDRRRADPVPVLRGDLRNDRGHRYFRLRWPNFSRDHARTRLIRCWSRCIRQYWGVRSFRREQVDYRSALRIAGGEPAPGALGWVVQIYNAAEALPNLVNPFWMLPLLGILKLKARDLVGYTVLQMFVHIPIVFFLMLAVRAIHGVCAADQISKHQPLGCPAHPEFRTGRARRGPKPAVYGTIART